MNTSKLILYTSLAFIGVAVSITACKKDDTPVTASEDTGYAADDALIERIYSEVQTMSDQLVMTGNLNLKGGNALADGCAIPTIDTTAKLVIINFGKTNCECKDGRKRRGRIVVSYTGKYNDTGSVHSYSFDNYYVDDYKVEGVKTVTNKPRNAQGYLSYTSADDCTLTSPDGTKKIYRNGTRTRLWYKGEGTVTLTDDEYSITGNCNLRRSGAVDLYYTTQIVQPLQLEAACNWFTKGTVEIIPAGYQARVLDYGNGLCDDQASLTINGKATGITMK